LGPVAERIIVPAEAFVRVAAERLAQAVRDRASAGMASVALAGGSTPRRVYADLAAQPGVPWESVRIYFGDERAVAPDHHDSNYRMACQALLSRVPIPESQVFRMHAEQADRRAAAVAYAALLPDRLDVLVLGVGSDGHTASLFPGSPAVRETVRTVVPALAPDPPRDRLTVTRVVIGRAREIVVLARGAGKAAAVGRALNGLDDIESCPARLARHGVWILDAEAAGEI